MDIRYKVNRYADIHIFTYTHNKCEKSAVWITSLGLTLAPTISSCIHIWKSTHRWWTVQRVSTWELCLRPSHTQQYVNFNVGGSTAVLFQWGSTVVGHVSRKMPTVCSLFLHRTYVRVWSFILHAMSTSHLHLLLKGLFQTKSKTFTGKIWLFSVINHPWATWIIPTKNWIK